MSKNNNLLSISGPMKSGKDTVGQMIQYLDACEIYKNYDSHIKDTLDEGFNINKIYSDASNWQIKKFAYKVKEVASILTGIPVEDFNKQEIKDQILGEEWWRYEVSYRTSPRLSFSSDLEFHNEVYSTLKEAELCTKDNLELDEGSLDIKIIKPSVRQLLQEIGTEAIRNQIHPNAWVNALFADYNLQFNRDDFRELAIQEGIIDGKKDGTIQALKRLGLNEGNINNQISEKYKTRYPKWIITDTRFPNEVKAVKDRDGILIKVNRDWRISAVTDLENGGTANDFIDDQLNKINEHPSETALDNYEDWDYVIDNNSSLEDLLVKVKEIYNQIKK